MQLHLLHYVTKYVSSAYTQEQFSGALEASNSIYGVSQLIFDAGTQNSVQMIRLVDGQVPQLTIV